MPQSIRITDWVGGTRASGRPCANLEGDQRLVASLLGGIPGGQGGAGRALQVEPIVGGAIHPELLGAIRTFQDFNRRDCGGWVDGLVSPDGATLKALNRMCGAPVPPVEERVAPVLSLASVTDGFRSLGRWDMIGTLVDGPKLHPLTHGLEFRVRQRNVEESAVSLMVNVPWLDSKLDLSTARGTFDLVIHWPATSVSWFGGLTTRRCRGEFRCRLRDYNGYPFLITWSPGIEPGSDLLLIGEVNFKPDALRTQILLFGDISPITRSGPDNGTESMPHPEGSGRIMVASSVRRRR